MDFYGGKTGPYANSRRKKDTLVLLFSPSDVSSFFSLFLKSNSRRVSSGTREMLLLYFYVGRVPSFREIGKQHGPWTIEGSLMYLMAREDGNSRVNEKWSNGKDKGRQRRWEARLAGNGFANTHTYIVSADISWMMRDEERWTKIISFSLSLSISWHKNFSD